MLPTAEQTSVAVVELANAGRFAEIRDLFAAQLRPLVTPDALQAAWVAALGRCGPLTSVGAPVSEPAGPGVVVVKVPITCERGALVVVVSVHESGVLTGLQLAPAGAGAPTAPWEPPGSVSTESFDEEEVILGSGPLAVPGTLTLPRGSGPRPAIILLGGSGPLDRDETIGRNKPFKDLAWGLASLGVAVLRFDKITYAHSAEAGSMPDFTVVDEYVPHAVSAIDLLDERPVIDAGRIFVLGHSLGGTVAPRVAAAKASVSGLVILAGGAQPLQWSIVRQLSYIASLDPETAAASQAAIDAVSEQARRVDSPDLSASTPRGELPFGLPAPYWLDLRSYDPVAAAAQLDRPMLILQGARDYQVTVDDDLALWSAGLAERADVSIRVYPSDNHLFFSGTGRSTPAEYEPAQHLDPVVVADIASWVMSHDPRPSTGTARS